MDISISMIKTLNKILGEDFFPLRHREAWWKIKMDTIMSTFFTIAPYAK